MLEQVMRNGIKRIYKEDMQSQLFYVREICEGVRNIDYHVVFDVNGFFVPNDTYFLQYFSNEVVTPEYGIYDSHGLCMWNNTLVLPITNVSGNIVGLAGYNPFKHLEAKEDNSLPINYYTYSTKSVFKKGDYLYCKEGTYREALRKGYLIVTDGIFDTLAFTAAGYLSAALLGSSVTDAIATQLRFINKIILAVDNDDAGMLLFEKISKLHHGAVFIKQNQGKDADDILKSAARHQYLKTVDECIHEELPLSKVFHSSLQFPRNK